ncbi:MAG: proteasome subunit alpha [Egibacteraceae bacterium]
MAMMPYVSPEQLMKDRAEFAQKGISRGKSVVGLAYADGVLFVSENPSTSLHKVSEIYDRIGFAAVGKYNEFEQLRVAGIRIADVKGYTYAREDVTGRALANAYANFLGAGFTESSKPFEVELVVAEVLPDGVELYHVRYDGFITDEAGYVAIGGISEAITTALADQFDPQASLQGALVAARHALSTGEDREVEPARLEVAGLDRTRGRRKFFRASAVAVAELLEATE